MTSRGFAIGKDWYIRFDHPFRPGAGVLLGLASSKGMFKACKDQELTDCAYFNYQEFEIGFGLFTIAIGESSFIEKENINE